MNRIVVILYKELEFLPPVMSLLVTLKELGENPFFIGVASASGKQFLDKNSIEHCFLPYDSGLYHNDTFLTKITHRISRVLRFYPCRRMLRSTLAKLSSETDSLTVWFAEVQSAALLGNAWKKYPRRIVSIYELADFYGSSWLGFDFRRFIRQTVIVEPEVNRAKEIQKHFKLSDLPCVVANKPSCHPRHYTGEIPSAARDVLAKAKGRPIFLYQGVWAADRRVVGRYLETIAKNRPQYCVVVMPGGGPAARLARECSNFFILDYVPPPGHLAVTGMASVGIAVYNSEGKTKLERLNALYCAPNKIYEYAGFGLPILGNDVPGLKDTVGRFGAGVCCSDDPDSILAAADELVRNHAQFSQAANAFFDATDLQAQVRAALLKSEVAR